MAPPRIAPAPLRGRASQCFDGRPRSRMARPQTRPRTRARERGSHASACTGAVQQRRPTTPLAPRRGVHQPRVACPTFLCVSYVACARIAPSIGSHCLRCDVASQTGPERGRSVARTRRPARRASRALAMSLSPDVALAPRDASAPTDQLLQRSSGVHFHGHWAPARRRSDVRTTSLGWTCARGLYAER
jgi:hypothetical protein